MAKRTQEEIQNICDDYKSGISLKKIILKYKIDNRTLNQLLLTQNVLKRTISQSHRTYNVNEHAFDILDSKKEWALGWYLADGCVYLGKKGHRLIIRLKRTDKCILYMLQSLFYPDGINRIKDVDQHRTYRGIKSIGEQSILEISSKYLVNRFIELGIHPRKSLNASYLEIIRSKPIKDQYQFIRGIFEGDGCISFQKKQKKHEYLCCSVRIVGPELFCNSIKEIVESFLQIKCSIYKNGKICCLTITNNNDCRKFLDWIYQDVNSGVADYFLPRKYERYLDFCKYMDQGIFPEKLTYSDLGDSHIVEEISDINQTSSEDKLLNPRITSQEISYIDDNS